MKKLLLSLAGAFMAMVGFNANAQNLYMMGAGDGLSWEAFPGKVITPQSDGSYTVTINNLNAFKISTANAANWDAFNAGAIGYSGTFGDAVGTSAGQTVTIGSWGENQQMPWIGTYTITINSTRTSMTVKTTTPKPTEAPAVYVRGGMNGWGSPDTYKFTYDNASESYSLTCSISRGVEFKIADANWGAINYGGPTNITATGMPVTLTSNGSNMTMGEDFNGTIVFKISGSSATATFTQSGSGPSYPENMYIIGTVNGGAWNPTNGVEMVNEGDGLYSAENVTFTEHDGSAGFALTAALGASDSDWAAVNAMRFGPPTNDSPVKINEENEAAMGDLSWSITPGTYSLYFDYNERILTVEGEGTPGIDPDPDPEGKAIYVVGSADGLTWDLPGKEYLPNTDGNYVLNLNNATQFKFSVNNTTEWDGDNGFNAGAYATGATTFGDAVGNAGGQTLPLEPWGENQNLPWKGNYTITIKGDFSQMTAYTATPKPTEAPDVYIRGAMNDWLNGGANPAWMFLYNKDNDEYTLECKGDTKIAAGVEFKIADLDWNTINYTYTGGAITPTAEGATINLDFDQMVNMTLSEDFFGIITFKVTGNNSAYAVFKKTGQTAVDSIETENGLVRYYNLQGVEIQNPEKGGIYIQVVNGKASKVVK